jgi:hypothetical protein
MVKIMLYIQITRYEFAPSEDKIAMKLAKNPDYRIVSQTTSGTVLESVKKYYIEPSKSEVYNEQATEK